MCSLFKMCKLFSLLVDCKTHMRTLFREWGNVLIVRNVKTNCRNCEFGESYENSLMTVGGNVL